MDNYILDGHTPVKTDNLQEWAEKFDRENRIVKQETIDRGHGLEPVKVSTVFLGLDHSFGSGPPILFETMVFGGHLDERQWRCSTWEQAEIQHQDACLLVLMATPEDKNE